jgi:hypothetical protein
VGDGKPGVRWNPHDECHTLHVNSAVEQSLVTLQYLLRSYVTSTIIANLARSRRLSESDSQSTDNTQSSASGAAAGSSHSTGNIESRGLGMTPQQLLALGASLAHMLPPSNLWRVVEEGRRWRYASVFSICTLATGSRGCQAYCGPGSGTVLPCWNAFT